MPLPDSPKSNHRQDFVKNYHQINEYFNSENEIFSYLWKEFSEQLVEPTDHGKDSQKTVFRNSIRPQDFFNLEALLNLNKINLRSIQSAPWHFSRE